MTMMVLFFYLMASVPIWSAFILSEGLDLLEFFITNVFEWLVIVGMPLISIYTKFLIKTINDSFPGLFDDKSLDELKESRFNRGFSEIFSSYKTYREFVLASRVKVANWKWEAVIFLFFQLFFLLVHVYFFNIRFSLDPPEFYFHDIFLATPEHPLPFIWFLVTALLFIILSLGLVGVVMLLVGLMRIVFSLRIEHFQSFGKESIPTPEETEEIALMTGIRDPVRLSRILREGISYSHYYDIIREEIDRIYALVLVGFVFLMAIILTYMLNEFVRRNEITILGVFLGVIVLAFALTVIGLIMMHFHGILSLIKFDIISDAEKKLSAMESFYLHLLKHPKIRERSQWNLSEVKESIDTMVRYLRYETSISEWPFNRQIVLELLSSVSVPIFTFLVQHVL